VSGVKRVRELEVENAKRKRMYATWRSTTQPSRRTEPKVVTLSARGARAERAVV
jgi:hypothetical protein